MSADGRRDTDADFGKKTYTGIREDGTTWQKEELQCPSHNRASGFPAHGWPQAVRKIADVKPQMAVVDARNVEYCDGAGIALLLQRKHTQERNERQIQIKSLRSEFEELMTLFDSGKARGTCV
jgi:ABC-type transporter Mla MlaB component